MNRKRFSRKKRHSFNHTKRIEIEIKLINNFRNDNDSLIFALKFPNFLPNFRLNDYWNWCLVILHDFF